MRHWLLILAVTSSAFSQADDDERYRFLYHLKRVEMYANQLRDTTIKEKLIVDREEAQFLYLKSGICMEPDSLKRCVAAWKRWYHIAYSDSLHSPIILSSTQIEHILNVLANDANRRLASLQTRCESRGILLDSCAVEQTYLCDDGNILASISDIGNEVRDVYYLRDAWDQLDQWRNWIKEHSGHFDWSTMYITAK